MNTFGSIISEADLKKMKTAINTTEVTAKELRKKLQKQTIDQTNIKKPELATAEPVKDKDVFERNKEGNLEKKIHGAGRELTRQVTLAKSVENNLSTGLEDNKTFVKRAKVTDNKRVLVFERAKNAIGNVGADNQDLKKSESEEMELAIKELESQIINPYSKLVYQKLGEQNKVILLDYLVDNEITPQDNLIIEMETISPANFNVVYFSDNGCLMQITNAQEVDNLVTDDKARFNIIAPNGSTFAQDINFKDGLSQLEDLSDTYQKELIAESEKQSELQKPKVKLDQEVDVMSFSNQYEMDREAKLGAELDEEAESEEEDIKRYNDEKESLGVTGANMEKKIMPITPITIAEKELDFMAAENQYEIDREAQLGADLDDQEKSEEEDVKRYNVAKKSLGVTGADMEKKIRPVTPVIIKELKTENEIVVDSSAESKDKIVNLEDSGLNTPLDFIDSENASESTSESNENLIDSHNNQETETAATVEKQEYESSPLFNKFVLSKLSGWSKENLESGLINENINRQNVTVWDRNYIIAGIVSFSSVGYSTYLTNEEDVKSENGIATKSEKAIYSLVGPDGGVKRNNLSYQEAENLLWSESEKYLTNLNREFEENKEAIEKELGVTENNEQVEINIEQKDISNTGEQNQKISKYAEDMGIKAEQLAAHPEFLELNEAQQQFVLEALNRASLYKIKVAAHDNFESEKENKKWYSLGFAFNQKFHKKKHEVLAAKEIHEKGLEGYGETEFSWLINVVKNGPEIIIDENGEVESVNYLKFEEDIDPERQKLIDEYNNDAYYLSKTPIDSPEYQEFSNYLKTSREKLLKSAKDDNDSAELVNKLIEAEKQLKLNQFLNSDPKNEQIIQKLVDNSLGSWQKFSMMLGGQKDKAGYMGIGAAARFGLRSELATAIIGKSFSYAVGPAVAAAIGGWRANTRARAGLKEQADLAQLGVVSQDKKIKNLNLAVGYEQEGDKVINIGLADKLDSLIEKYNLLKNKFDGLDTTSGTSTEEEWGEARTELSKVFARLIDRVKYTSQKMEDGLVSFGNPAERSLNYYRLLNSLEEAKSLVFNKEDIVGRKASRTHIDKSVTKLTRSKDNLEHNNEFNSITKQLGDVNITLDKRETLEKRRQEMVNEWNARLKSQELLEDLQYLSIEERLASFLNFKEEQRESAEFKYLVKETAKGAVIGATFAAVGAWIFEHTGLGNWSSHQLSNLGRLTHADQALNWTKSLFTTEQVGGGKAVEKIATVANQTITENSSSANVSSGNQEVVTGANQITTETPASVETPSSNQEVVTGSNQTQPSNTIDAGQNINQPVAATTEVIKTVKIETAPKTYSEHISSKPGQSNSVWRSLREIFKSNSQSLGYKGDLNNTEAVNHWAETQTANTIHNSGDVTDKVFEGNKVLLTQEGGQFKVAVESGEGGTPGYLDHEVPKTNQEIYNDLKFKPGDDVNDFDKSALVQTVPASNPMPTIGADSEAAAKTSTAITGLAKIFHVSPEAIKSVGNEIVYQNKGGKIVFDTTKNVIKEVFDANNKSVPNEFIDELRGRASMDKFASRGGLEKIFTNWNKLGANDKTVYEMLHSFNLSKLASADLINKISGTFNVVAKGVMVDLDAKHFVLGNREFKIDSEGVHKLVRVLTRRFGA